MLFRTPVVSFMLRVVTFPRLSVKEIIYCPFSEYVAEEYITSFVGEAILSGSVVPEIFVFIALPFSS